MHPSGELPAGDLAADVQAQALSRGLILELGGRDGCVVRLLPPLNVTEEIMEAACRILVDCIDQLGVEGRLSPHHSRLGIFGGCTRGKEILVRKNKHVRMTTEVPPSRTKGPEFDAGPGFGRCR